MSNQEDLSQNENTQNIEEQELDAVTGGGNYGSYFPRIKQPTPIPTLGVPDKFGEASRKPGPGLPSISESPTEGQEVPGVNHGDMHWASQRKIDYWNDMANRR